MTIPARAPLALGLIGLSSAGKTTLFNLLTRPDMGKSHPSGRSDAEEGLAQVLFFESDEDCETSYLDRGGKYQGQRGINPPRM